MDWYRFSRIHHQYFRAEFQSDGGKEPGQANGVEKQPVDSDGVEKQASKEVKQEGKLSIGNFKRFSYRIEFLRTGFRSDGAAR